MKRRIAYPAALVLVVLGSYVGMAYGVAGTMNGATILAVLLIAAAFYVAGKARRDDENPVADEPARKPSALYSTARPDGIHAPFGDPVLGDVWYQQAGSTPRVTGVWVFDGELWQEKAL